MRVTRGAIFDVALDLRPDSPRFLDWVGFRLDAANRRALYVPEGFAHGFLTLSDETDFLYKCTAPYAPQSEHTLAWDDSAVGIDWPEIGMEPIISEKDADGATLNDVLAFV